MLISDLGKGVNIEKIELVQDHHLGQSIFIVKNLQKDLLIQSSRAPKFTTDTWQELPTGLNPPKYMYALTSCKFVKTTQKNNLRVTLL